MYMKGDRVKVLVSGKIGTVIHERTAVEDLWVLVDLNGESDYFKPSEIELANVSTRRWLAK